jgi:nuclear protein localization family protein 4
MQKLKSELASKPFIQVVSDFHVLFYLLESSLLDGDSCKLICNAIKSQSEADIVQAENSGAWETVKTVLGEFNAQEASNSTARGQSSGARSNAGPWSCRHCTFMNISGDSCEMCGLPNE